MHLRSRVDKMGEAEAKTVVEVTERLLDLDVASLKAALDKGASLHEIKLEASRVDESLKDFEKGWRQHMFANKANLDKDDVGEVYFKKKTEATRIVRTRAQMRIEDVEAEASTKDSYPNAHLPKRSILKFDGNQRNWDRFWMSFKPIHNSGLPRDAKFGYLLESLTGSARDIADGYAVNESSYESLIAQLRARYERPELAVYNLRRDIFCLEPPQTDDPNSLESFVIKTESICKQLKEKKESNDQVESLIAVGTISKLSPNILQELNFMSVNIYKVKLAELLEALKNLIGFKKMNAHSLVSDFNQIYSVKSNKKMAVWEKPKASVQTISAGPNLKAKQQATSNKKCIFCQNNHKAMQCSVFTTSDDRKRQAKKKGLCTRCLGTNHGSCNRKIYCHLCKKDNHHSFLCRGNTQKRQKALPLQSEIEGSVPVLLMNGSAQEQNGVHSGLLHIQADNKVQKPQLKLQTGVFPTAKIKVGKARSSKHVPVRSLWDSCSSSSYMTRELAESLKLKSTNTNVEIEVSMGLNEQAQTCHFDVVYANVRIANENRRLQFLVVEKLPYRLFNPGMKEACDDLRKAGVKLADDIDSDVISQIQVLLGGFHMSMFVNGVQRKLGINLLQIPSGFMPFGGLGKFRARTLHKISQSVMSNKETGKAEAKTPIKVKNKRSDRRKNTHTSNNVVQYKGTIPSMTFVQQKDVMAMEHPQDSEEF